MNSRSTLVRAALLLALTLAGTGHAEAQVRWQLETETAVIGQPVVSDGVLYFAAGHTLFATSPGGESSWQRDLEGEIAAGVRVEGERIFVHSSAGLRALDRRGETLWFFEDRDLGPLVDGRSWGWGDEILADPWHWYRSAPVVEGELVYYGSSAGVQAVAVESGEKRWRVPVGPVTADPLVSDGTLIAASWNNSLYGLDAGSGKLEWRFRAGVPSSKGVDWIGYSGANLTPILAGERLFVGTRGTWFYALDPGDGTEVWSSKVGASWIGSPAVALGEAVYYGLSDGNAVMGHLQAGGKQTLFFETGGAVFGQPALHGRHLVFGTLAGKLFMVDTASGEGRLLVDLGHGDEKYGAALSPSLVPEGLVGHEAASWSIENMLRECSSILNLAVADGMAYVATSKGLYAVELPPDQPLP